LTTTTTTSRALVSTFDERVVQLLLLLTKDLKFLEIWGKTLQVEWKKSKGLRLYQNNSNFAHSKTIRAPEAFCWDG
jgi:hypothetical protein